MERSAVAGPAGSMHGFPAALTSFVGRAGVVDEVAGQLGEHRLVTVTGPGGAGKTRLAGEVATQVAGRFADGVWLAELAAVRDPAQVAAAVAAALGIRDLPSVAAADALAHALARRQLLLVLDNCEHVIGAAAELCGRLLLGADDVRVLATSREALRIAGEVRCRLGPLTLPDPDDPADVGESEAVTLFADRAWLVDPRFALDVNTAATVARLVARLDGMPLAIELAAARVDALGVAQLLDHIDDRFALLGDGDRLAEQRQRSLAAAVQWSYQLLDDFERRVFRAVAVFPGPFTLEGAEAVAGAGAGRAVLRLVDCSLLVPPRVDPDGRSRYLMLETLRAYGARLLAEAGEDGEASTALASFAVEVAEEAVVGLHTRTWEVAGIRHLDAEEVTLRHALAWAMDHDPATALRLALAQVPWWQLRGRMTVQAPLLAAAAEHAEVGSNEWCAARMCLGQVAVLSADPAGAWEYFTLVRDTLEDTRRPVSPARPVLLAICLGGRSSALLHLGRVDEAAGDGRGSLAMAQEAGYKGLEALALACLSVVAWYGGDRDGAIQLARQAQQIPDEFSGALYRALSQIVTMVLTEAGDLAAAEQVCTEGLTSCRVVGDLGNLAAQLRNRAILDLRAGRIEDAAAHLHEQLQIAMQAGERAGLLAGLDCCGYLCTATRRQAEAVTVWAAMSALADPWPPLLHRLWLPGQQEELLRKARQMLGPTRTRAAEERGAAMTLATAAEYALMLAAAEPQPPAPAGRAAAQGPAAARAGQGTGGRGGEAAVPDRPTADGPMADGPAAAGAADGATVPGMDKLSPRERELVTLVAQGRTDAQIAAQLYISMRTVSSHLDRIRDKTGCRRRADLTRLALSAGLV
jgi:predicted ATPase/DNA-binding CsgD family transcriptional regulator